MEQFKDIIKNWKWVYLFFIVKIVFFYLLVDVKFEQILMGLITLGFLSVLFDSLRRQQKKWSRNLFFGLYILISVIMIIDVGYYNYFIQYSSVYQIYQLDYLLATANQLNMGSILTITEALLLLADVPFVFYYFIRSQKRVKEPKKKFLKMTLSVLRPAAVIVLVILAFNPLNDVFIKSINHVEFFSYHSSDLVRFTEGMIVRANVDQEEILKTLEENVPKSNGEKYKGVGKGKNLIVIQMESFQNFPIGREYNGQVLTPTMNELIQSETLYFPNYFQSIGKGNTSDAEFASLNSFYPVIERESYRRYIDNTFNGLPWLMRSQGYEALAFHGYVKTFWNREEAYKKHGFQKFYSEEELEMTEKSGFGLTDKEMFRQAVDILKEKEEPTFSFMVTLTNHIPYQLSRRITNLTLLPEDEGTMFGRYLQAVRYADEAVGDLIRLLKENDMYENTVIAMYGDHHGMLNEYDDVKASMEQYLGYEYDYDEMLNIPLLIHLPGTKISETIETVGGQVDFLPTIANIMDFEIPQPYVFGKDLVNTDDGFVASVTYLLEGSFIKDDIMYQIGRDDTFSGGRAWSISTREEKSLDGLEEYEQRARTLVRLSKRVLDYDLMVDYPPTTYNKN